MMALMVSISGIRGVVGSTLTPDVIIRYVAGFGSYCRSRSTGPVTVVVGRDGRITGAAITDMITSALTMSGIHVMDIGICPTPTVQLAVEHEHAAGGIAITASHNPMQWNGMKFMASTGLFLDGAENAEFWKHAGQPHTYVAWDAIGTLSRRGDWLARHIALVLDLPLVKPDVIRKRRFRVVVDCVNAAGGAIVPALLRELGCDVIEMACDVSGVFSHTPEPIPENLTGLAGRVRSEHADLGIAVDPDVDRLVLINEKGEPYGEEYTIATVVDHVLKTQGGKGQTVVANLSTTRAVDDIARRYGATPVRTPVGEINVASAMKRLGAVVGGEGSGGVILPALHYGRDAIVGIGLILQALAESGGTLSQLKASLPQYCIAKGKMELAGIAPEEVLETMKKRHATEGTVNTDDGVKIDFPDAWVHFRKSNTEPIVRIIGESATMESALALVTRFQDEIRTLMPAHG
ncbi:MAG: phosphoglucosamine mutase [Ignavibacteriae bacterium]|nr:phosphoglucosamine mutase [Ignavibacteriota bacterium]